MGGLNLLPRATIGNVAGEGLSTWIMEVRSFDEMALFGDDCSSVEMGGPSTIGMSDWA